MIALISDLHIHPFKQYSRILEPGFNSRLMDLISCLDQFVEFCEENRDRLELILCGGDVFHVRKNLHVGAFNLAYSRFERLSKLNIPIVTLVGNHDQADEAGQIHSLETFRYLNIDVVDKPKSLLTNNTELVCIPYTEDLDAIRDTANLPKTKAENRILFFHLGVQGAVVGSDFVLSNQFDPHPDDLNFSAFDIAFGGHYHKTKQQIAPNAFYIGSMAQTNWGDSGDQKGFLTYDKQRQDPILFHSLRSPRYVWAKESDCQNTGRSYDGDFVRVRKREVGSIEEREVLRSQLQASSLEIVVDQPTKEIVNRLNITPASSLDSILEEYIKLTNPVGLSDARLIALGQRLISDSEFN